MGLWDYGMLGLLEFWTGMVTAVNGAGRRGRAQGSDALEDAATLFLIGDECLWVMWARLYVEAEVHYITILYNVFFAFNAHFTRLFDRLF